jgi:hypothetical protein
VWVQLAAHSRGACCSEENAPGAVEEATAEAAKHEGRNEPLTALVAKAKVRAREGQSGAGGARMRAAEAAEAGAA